MKVRAKFTCNSVTNFMYGQEIEMAAIYGHQGENRDFCEATPSGSLKMCIDKQAPAFDSFVPGNNYYLTFEEAE